MTTPPDSSTEETRTSAVRQSGPAPVARPVVPAQALGRYVVLSEVGSGGMGRVYAAYDPKLDRRVAVKVVHTQSNDDDRGRLMREARSLARLSHPNVVAIHEIDEFEGHPLIAMEFVEGGTLKQWLASHPPDGTDARLLEALELLLQAGRGLAAAHAQGLVHRDFKPHNVLVGADGRVRVADFGLARTQDRDAEVTASKPPPPTPSSRTNDEKSRITRTGNVVGTPAYMAPEQTTGRIIDHRSDQFSFCVTAWELLFGVRPYEDNRNGGVPQGRRDTESDHAREASIPPALEKALRKGLAMRPEARHRNIEPLLDRFANEVEILRGRTSRRRSKWPRYAAAAGLVVAAGYGATVLNDAWLTQRCTEQGAVVDEFWNEDSRDALKRGLSATKIGGLLQLADKTIPWVDKQASSWREDMTTACMNARVHKIWTDLQRDKAYWCLEDRRLELEVLVNELTEADDIAAQNAVQAAANLAPTQLCLDDRALEGMVAPPEVDQQAALAGVRASLSRLRTLQATGRYEAALELARSTRQEAQALGWEPLVVATQHAEAVSLDQTGDYKAAETTARTAFVDASRANVWEVAAASAVLLTGVLGTRQRRHADGRLWAELATVALSHAGDPLGLREANRANELASALVGEGDYDAAIELYRGALATIEEVLGPDHPAGGRTYHRLGIPYLYKGDYDSAIEFFYKSAAAKIQTLGEKHPDVGSTHSAIGVVYFNKHEDDKALEFQEKAIAIFEEALGEDYMETASAYEYLANTYSSRDDDQTAMIFYQKALSIRKNVFGEDHPDVAISYRNIAMTHRRNGNYEAGFEYATKALSIQRQSLGEMHRETAFTYDLMGGLHNSKGEYLQAVDLYRKAAEVWAATVGENHPDTARAYINLGHAYHSAGQYSHVVRTQQKAIAIFESLGGKQPDAGSAYQGLAGAYYELGEYPKAVAAQQKSIAIFEELLGKSSSTARAYSNLAMIHAKARAYKEALAAYRTALAINEEIHGPTAAPTVKCAQNIAKLCKQHKYKPACAGDP